MNHKHFRTLLRELDCESAAKASIMHHHVEGVHYLCLHRSEQLTVKLYFIDPALMPHKRPGKYLVTPHTHRYAFDSVVLQGRLTHVRFNEAVGSDYQSSEYTPETRRKESLGEVNLFPAEENHGIGSSYFCDTSDIHTLVVPKTPVLLGLLQFSDTERKSRMYVYRNSVIDYPESYTPSPDETLSLKNLALDMLS